MIYIVLKHRSKIHFSDFSILITLNKDTKSLNKKLLRRIVVNLHYHWKIVRSINFILISEIKLVRNIIT